MTFCVGKWPCLISFLRLLDFSKQDIGENNGAMPNATLRQLKQVARLISARGSRRAERDVFYAAETGKKIWQLAILSTRMDIQCTTQTSELQKNHIQSNFHRRNGGVPSNHVGSHLGIDILSQPEVVAPKITAKFFKISWCVAGDAR